MTSPRVFASLICSALVLAGCAFKYPGDYAPDGGPVTCHNDQLDQGEDCDGELVGDATCRTQGFSGGTLACTASCTFDTSMCTTAAVPTVPQLRTPMNDSYVGTIHTAGTMQPRFAWEPSTWTGTGTIEYELQLSTDAQFTADVDSIVSTATSHRPATDLPVRMIAPVGTRYYWHVRACVDDACSAYSATRWVNVGRSDHDLNGDGFADVVISSASPGTSRVFVYFGRTSNPMTGPDNGVLEGPSEDLFGRALAIVPDLNDDGFSDLVVAAERALVGAEVSGRVYVYLGGAGATFDTSVDRVIDGPGAGVVFGRAVVSAGDVNGDGVSDLLIGTWYPAEFSESKVFLFHGRRGAVLAPDADTTLIGPRADGFGNMVASAGDMNGDGFSDVVISGRPFFLGIQRTLLFYGTSSGTDETSDVSLVDPMQTADTFGETLSYAGDINTDGFADLVAHNVDANGAHVSLYIGGRALPVMVTPGGRIFQQSAYFGTALDALGDANGDGFDDLLVGDSAKSTAPYVGNGAGYAYLGGAGAFDTSSDATLSGDAEGARLGAALAGAGDVNGDGLADFVVGAPGGAGHAYLHLGSRTSPLDTSPDATISGTGPFDKLGGAVD